MTLYIGVDLHPHQQTVAVGDTETGETRTIDLEHDLMRVREFYAGIGCRAIVGIEASARSRWFERMLVETGHELVVGNPVLIRKRAVSRHKSDRRDAELILQLLMRGEFPAIWRREAASDEVLDMLGLRQGLVRQRTQIFNRLQAMAHDRGLPKGWIRNRSFQAAIKQLEMNEAEAMKREHLFSVVEHLSVRIRELEGWLKAKAEVNKDVQLLMTQKGVGYLAALTCVHTIGDISRFPRLTKQVVSFTGFDPVEHSSAGRIRFGSISKAGPALLRYQLGISALLATRSDKRLKAFYKRLAKKKPKAVARTAAARKLLVKLVIMLRDQITADEFDRRGRTVGNARSSHGLK